MCQTNKDTNQKSVGLLTSLPIPTGNSTDISTALIVALPHTTTGYDAIPVWVCRLSKMADLSHADYSVCTSVGYAVCC